MISRGVESVSKFEGVNGPLAVHGVQKRDCPDSIGDGGTGTTIELPTKLPTIEELSEKAS